MKLKTFEVSNAFRLSCSFAFFLLFRLIPAVCADTFYHILRLFRQKAFGQRNRRNHHVGQAIGVVADVAGEVDMTEAASSVVNVTDTVFLSACSVINLVQQMGIAK
jgi:hypothetical protein